MWQKNKTTKLLCCSSEKLLHSSSSATSSTNTTTTSSSSSAVEVVRQDQDEPGDVNLLLSPLTLAFAGGNTLAPPSNREVLFADAHRSEERRECNICTTREKKRAIDTTTHASKSGLVYRILDVGDNRMEDDILL